MDLELLKTTCEDEFHLWFNEISILNIAITRLKCQRSKIHQHTAAPLCTFATPDVRLNYVHIDLVGPFPPSNGCVYILTCIDRPEAVSIADSTAETVSQAFLGIWISRFSVKSTITTDCGCLSQTSGTVS